MRNATLTCVLFNVHGTVELMGTGRFMCSSCFIVCTNTSLTNHATATYSFKEQDERQMKGSFQFPHPVESLPTEMKLVHSPTSFERYLKTISFRVKLTRAYALVLTVGITLQMSLSYSIHSATMYVVSIASKSANNDYNGCQCDSGWNLSSLTCAISPSTTWHHDTLQTIASF